MNNSKTRDYKDKDGLLTRTGEKEIIIIIGKFQKWLIKKGIVTKESQNHIKEVADMPSMKEDWLMKMDDGSVSFNKYITKKCTFEYYVTIVIHEFFHLAVQGIPNKEDAVRVKDDFGDAFMKLIDIQADFFTALFHKEVLKINLTTYLGFYYEGRNVFSDTWIRQGKFERFIGTLMTIFKMYDDHPGNTPVSQFNLYLPTIGPISTENSLHILKFSREHIMVISANVSSNEFTELKSCYINKDTLTKKGHIEKMIQFCCAAFKQTIPVDIQKQINILT